MKLICVMVFHRLLSIGVWGVHVSSVYVHSAIVKLIGVTVFHTSIVNWSGGEMYPQYMYILLYVKLMWCNGISEIYC